MRYTPPTTQDLAALKHELGFTGKQMADLFGLAGDHQWRKYTGGQSPREVSPQMLFFAMSRLALDASAIETVLDQMRKVGGAIDLSPDSES